MISWKATKSWSLGKVNQLNSVLASIVTVTADIVTVKILLWLLLNLMHKLMALIDTLSW